MKEDRKLLKLAADATGKKWKWVECPTHDGKVPGFRHVDSVTNAVYWFAWNPLEDDGDALRMFTRMPFCELYVSEIGVTVFLPRKTPGDGPNLKCDEYAAEHGGDMDAATRRAIVRAAAEIQRQREASK